MTPPRCPVCDGEMHRTDIPKYNIVVCTECHEVGQVVTDGTIAPITALLDRAELGDDRVSAAISKPHVRSVASFIEIFENATRMWQMDMATAAGGLRTILAQVENRLDYALSVFSGLDLVSDGAADGLRMLREARELVSTLPSRQRGIAG